MQITVGVTITVCDKINCTGRNPPNCYGCMSPANHKTLRYQELAERLAELIRQGTYPPGTRIPSVRQMSQQQNLSISTVLEAYSLLESQGLIEARPQSGYYVRAHMEERLPEPEISSPRRDPSLVSMHELVMMLMRDSADPELVQLGAALPHLDSQLIQKVNQIITKVIRQQGVIAHQYHFPPGLETLRAQIARRMVTAGCNLSPADILITSGGTEAIDFGLHAVCRPGDIVAIESPSYFGAFQTLEVHGLRALEIPTHPRDGISLEALEFAIEHNPIRAVFVISNFNNPLG
ncbi:MAG: PLP-dependent aminotransferase family protein, partial [Chloroflexi bacterium]